jgi:hypothetical protein
MLRLRSSHGRRGFRSAERQSPNLEQPQPDDASERLALSDDEHLAEVMKRIYLGCISRTLMPDCRSQLPSHDNEPKRYAPPSYIRFEHTFALKTSSLAGLFGSGFETPSVALPSEIRLANNVKEFLSSSHVNPQTPLFGVELSTATEHSRLDDNLDVPSVVRRCVAYITEHGLNQEGLYRLSGRKTQIEHLKQLFDEQHDVNLDVELPNGEQLAVYACHAMVHGSAVAIFHCLSHIPKHCRRE